MSDIKPKDFNIYYLNFSKVYEIAMMINNVILTKIDRDNRSGYSTENDYIVSLSAKGTKKFLKGIKSSISSEIKDNTYSSMKVVESLDVKTTKSILLRRVIEKCVIVKKFGNILEGDLIKIDGVRLEFLDEESLRQLLILKRDALKGMQVEGMEVNNLIISMLQDYAYILKGAIATENGDNAEIMIKIPMDVQPEFESQYSIDDLLIGHVSVVGIYKGIVKEAFISSNTFSYLQEASAKQKSSQLETSKIFKSNTPEERYSQQPEKGQAQYHFIDTLAIIQDVAFDYQKSVEKKLHWWNKIGIWLSRLGRK